MTHKDDVRADVRRAAKLTKTPEFRKLTAEASKTRARAAELRERAQTEAGHLLRLAAHEEIVAYGILRQRDKLTSL